MTLAVAYVVSVDSGKVRIVQNFLTQQF